MKKLSVRKKRYIQSLKDKIILSDNYFTKYRDYILLVRYLKNNLGIKEKIYTDKIFIDYKIENNKISAKDTIIFSLSPSLICYSAIKNNCQLYKNKKCYALRNELQYNTSILFKDRQALQFKKLKVWQLARYFIRIKKLYPAIKFLRLNESGDIQKKHIEKINKIADILKKYNIKIYSYTHNKEIKKSDITSDNFVLNSSNEDINLSNKFLSYSKEKISELKKQDKTILSCKADCSKCKLCTLALNKTILCELH